MKMITREKWQRTPKDYRSTIKGQKYVLEFVPGVGTSLVPVQIIERGKPEEGKIYALTGGIGSKCIMNGSTWAESEVK